MVAETKQSTDERLRLWVAEIRELAYDAEDVVEEYAFKIESENKGVLPSCIKRSACCFKEEHKTRSKIEKIIERINDLVRRLQAYGVKELKDRGEESSSSTERRESRRPYPHIMDDYIVELRTRKLGIVSKHCVSSKRFYSPNIRSLLFFNQFLSGKVLEKSLPLKVLNYVKEHEDEVWNPLYWILVGLVGCSILLKAWGIWRYMFNNFKLLRVLNYEIERTPGGCKLPSDIGSLVHLRFLSLRNFDFQCSKLPSSLGNLRCLQTLDLRVGNSRVHVPNVIWRMEQLTHLYLPWRCKGGTKLELGTLRKLLTLVNFNTKSCYLKDLINMTNLRELVIKGPFNIENFNEEELGENPPIMGSKYLHSLSIVSFWSDRPIIDPRHLDHLLSSCTSKDDIFSPATAIHGIKSIFKNPIMSIQKTLLYILRERTHDPPQGEGLTLVVSRGLIETAQARARTSLGLRSGTNTSDQSCNTSEGWTLHKTRSKIEEIIESINDLVRRLQAYGVKELKNRGEESSFSTERRESRRPYPHIMDDNIVGLLRCLSEPESWELFQKIVFPQTVRTLSLICLKVNVFESPHKEGTPNPNIRSLLFFNEFFPEEALEKYLPLEVLNYVEEHAKVWNPLFLILMISIAGTALLKSRGIWRYMFNNFKLLRVLNYEERTGGNLAAFKLPSDIGNLIHLRFLSLKDLEFQWKKLPSSLGNLRCLQTLDLRVANYKIHVPNVIWRMEQLRHLYLPDICKKKTKLKLGTLRKLLTLVNFNTKNCYLKDLINMTNLRELVINGPFNIENFNEKTLGENPSIIGSKYLHSLFILFSSINPRHLAHLLSSSTSICKLSITTARISKLPEYHYFSSHLAYIRLENCQLEEDPMPTLEKLPNLRILEFEETFRVNEMLCSAQGFSRLESLSLERLHNLEEWKVDEGAMPSLQRLEIRRCPSLKMLPEGLRFITTLKELKIESMPKAFKDKLVKGGEDFYKVRHVPSIIFQDCDYLDKMIIER
ncbi:hypothetical protein CXB51_029193 [Gossypium anomalum]|uniref:Rx N-terminal domain-containing protein n=1 Tax=Gossypium anomalum TaxID=47600 RepID=A0A8J5YBU8_9ROSI|nr:hypothetical protein CXB51_029193 [Gossypium anomalum]